HRLHGSNLSGLRMRDRHANQLVDGLKVSADDTSLTDAQLTDYDQAADDCDREIGHSVEIAHDQCAGFPRTARISVSCDTIRLRSPTVCASSFLASSPPFRLRKNSMM